jgi:secondary thiamine-phosphate synthase enzyme
VEFINQTLQLATTAEVDALDLTDRLDRLVAASGLRQGQLTVFVPGSTAGVTTIEYEDGVIEDLKSAIDRLAPLNIPYAHDRRWGDGNGYSHVRAALTGPSLNIPIIEGRLALGTWQQVVLLDFDNRPRTRRLLVQLIGKSDKGTTSE